MTMSKMEFIATANILSDPNVLIGDTGASSETTALDLGFRNVRPATASDNKVDVSGSNLVGQTTGDMAGVFCDKYGN